MTELEKVICDLEERIYDSAYVELPRDEAENILALLKAQEPAKPAFRRGKAFCGGCGCWIRNIDGRNNFCSNCGKAVKWE